MPINMVIKERGVFQRCVDLFLELFDLGFDLTTRNNFVDVIQYIQQVGFEIQRRILIVGIMFYYGIPRVNNIRE